MGMQGCGMTSAVRLTALLALMIDGAALVVVEVPPLPGALQAAVDAAAAAGLASATTLALAAGIHTLDHTLTLNQSHAGLYITVSGGGGARPLGAADAPLASSSGGSGGGAAVISGGTLLHQGWTLRRKRSSSASAPPIGAPLETWRTPLSLPPYPPRVRSASFRTVRYGAELATPARYPDADLPGEQPYLGGKFLFVENVTSLSYHPNINGLLLNFTVAKAGLPPGWEQWDWRRVEIMVWLVILGLCGTRTQ